MTTDALYTGERPGLIARARDILIRPQSEWRRIASEEPAPLIRSYVLPLAVLGAVVGFAASVLYAGSFEINAALALKAVSAVLYIVFAVLGLFVASWAINALAPRFGAEANSGRAGQLAAYAATPILIAAFAAVAPPVAGVVAGIGVIYAFILLALGAQKLMLLSDPDNNVPRFTLALVGVAIVVVALIATFINPLIQSGREALSAAIETVAPPPAAPELPRRAAAEEAIDRLSQANATSILSDPARLAEQFPDTLPSGFARQSVTHAQRGGISRADSVYRAGAATLSVAIIQFGGGVDPAALASLLAIKPDGPQDGGYARTQAIDGRFYAEEVGANSARYVVIGRGVVMVAEGRVTMDQARAAIETIGLQRLESMFGR